MVDASNENRQIRQLHPPFSTIYNFCQAFSATRMNIGLQYTIIAIILSLVQLSIFDNLDLILMTTVFIVFNKNIQAGLIFASTSMILMLLVAGSSILPLLSVIIIAILTRFIIRTILATKTLFSLLMLGVGAYLANWLIISLVILVMSIFGYMVTPQLSWSLAGVFFYKLLIDLFYLSALYWLFARSKYATRAFLITGR